MIDSPELWSYVRDLVEDVPAITTDDVLDMHDALEGLVSFPFVKQQADADSLRRRRLEHEIQIHNARFPLRKIPQWRDPFTGLWRG